VGERDDGNLLPATRGDAGSLRPQGNARRSRRRRINPNRPDEQSAHPRHWLSPELLVNEGERGLQLLRPVRPASSIVATKPPERVERPVRDTSSHRLNRNRRALIATITVDSDISTAPAAGVSRMPAGYRSPAAIGIATALYPVAHQRFWTILRYVA